MNIVLITVSFSAQIVNNVNHIVNDIPQQFKSQQPVIPEYFQKHLAANKNAFEPYRSNIDSGIHLVSHFSRGACTVVASYGNYVYAGCGPTMLVIDVSNALSPTIVSEYKTQLDGTGNVNDIKIQDTLLYLLDGYTLQILSIKNPTNPILLGYIFSPPGTVTDKISLNDTLAYMLHLNNGGIKIVNIKNPVNPFVIKTGGGVGFGATTISSSGGVVYSGSFESSSDGLYIFNYQNLDSLSLDFLNTNGWVMETWVKDTLLFVGVDSRPGNHVKIYSIKNPITPVLISNFFVGNGYPDYIINALNVKDNMLYVSTVSKGVYELDISDPAMPVLLNHIEKRSQYYPATGNNFAFNNTHLFVSNISGILTLSLKPSDSLKVLGFSPIGSQYNDIVVRDTIAYVADYYGLGIYNVTDPEKIVKITDIEAPGPTVQIKVVSNYAYLTCEYLGTAIYDVSDPYNPVFLSLAKYVLNDGSNPTDIIINNKNLFVLDYNDGILTFNIIEKEAPVFLSKYPLHGHNLSLAIMDSVLFVARMDSGIAMINISTPEIPKLMDYLNLFAEGIKINDSLLYVKGDGYISIYSIANLQNPRLLSKSYNPSAYYNQPMVINEKWLYNRKASALYAFDVSNLESLQLRYSVSVGGAPFGLDVINSFIYICDALKGIKIFKNDDVTSIIKTIPILPNSLDQNYPNPFNPSTTLRFTILERSNIRLFIFNTLGQKISEIVNETKEAGSYEQSFNASQLSSGIYFYRMEAIPEQHSGRVYVETKKMILMK